MRGKDLARALNPTLPDGGWLGLTQDQRDRLTLVAAFLTPPPVPPDGLLTLANYVERQCSGSPNWDPKDNPSNDLRKLAVFLTQQKTLCENS